MANTNHWIAAIEAFEPTTTQEQQDKLQILAHAAEYGDTLLQRDCPAQAHITCSGFVMDESLSHVLMVYHNIYQSFAWTGGHADGDGDLLAVAIREAQEETGITVCEPITSSILSMEILPVREHQKRGKTVAAHHHDNISYGLIARKREALRCKPDENSDVQWIPADALADYCKEPDMIPIYERLIQRMRDQKHLQDKLLMQMQQPLLEWYPTVARDLPWRRDKDPYHVWLSEIMLQQTRVETVIDYYHRFLNALPTVQDLAAASPELLHKLWEGLGYYTRVRNLQKAAQTICQDFGGCFPTDHKAWLKLSGVGSYTAGAVCSICFGLPCAAVDGNVLRVVMRLWDCHTDIMRNGVKEQITDRLSAVYPEQQPTDCGTLTQALMELGATVCIPNGTPHCEACPLYDLCLSRKHDTWRMLPCRTKKAARTIADKTVFLLKCGEHYAIQKRPNTGLLAGLWEFPNMEGKLSLQDAIQQARLWQCEPIDVIKTMEQQHIFTHREWHMHAVVLACKAMPNDFCWATLEELDERYALPTAFRKLL